MSRSFLYIPLAAAALFLTSCLGPSSPREPQRSQLEIRQMQTHVFDVSDFHLVMKAMLNVLQDEGYVVKNIQTDIGFLTAQKEVDVEAKGLRFWFSTYGTADHPRWDKTSVIDVTANVTEMDHRTKVRVNFQVKRLDNYGSVVSVFPIKDPNYYQDFFAKVSKSIFIQEEKI